MKQFKIHYTGNTYKELSVIFNKMNWKVIKSDETEFDGELTDGSFISNEYNRIFLVNKNGEIPVDIITKYEFNIRKNKQSTLLFFSYKIVEIKTNIEINNLNDNKNLVEIKKLINSKDLLEIKELIDNKFYFKKEIITNQLIRKRQNIIGRNFEPPFEEKYASSLFTSGISSLYELVHTLCRNSSLSTFLFRTNSTIGAGVPSNVPFLNFIWSRPSSIIFQLLISFSASSNDGQNFINDLIYFVVLLLLGNNE